MSRATATRPHVLMNLSHLSDRKKLAFDFTVMRGHDKYVDTNHRVVMGMVENGDDMGINRIFQTLRMLLMEVG